MCEAIEISSSEDEKAVEKKRKRQEEQSEEEEDIEVKFSKSTRFEPLHMDICIYYQ